MILTGIRYGVEVWVVLLVSGLAAEQLLDKVGISKAETKAAHAHWFCKKSDCLGYMRIM